MMSGVEEHLAYPERRTAQRFRIKLPLLVRWTNGGSIGEAQAESQDVSSRGIYFSLPKNVKAGSPVEIVLTLPHEITMAGPVRVRCLGRIQRNEDQQAGYSGMVAEIERYEFLRSDEHANYAERSAG